MPKVNVRQTDPVRYARVAAEQDALKKTYGSQMQIARLCPYCGHKVEHLCRGTHSGAYTKCPSCGKPYFSRPSPSGGHNVPTVPATTS